MRRHAAADRPRFRTEDPTMRPLAPLTALCATVLLAGCATAPKPLQGTFGSQSPQQAAAAGERVRWGGSVIEVEPEASRTCFQVLGKPLAANGRPREVDASEGRFLACRAGFYDPAVFTAGREITVVGALDGSEPRTVGEYALTMPRVAADAIHLWPERVEPRYRYDPYYFWSPLGWHGWYGPSLRYHRVPYVAPKSTPQPAPSTPPQR
jgi:outer membrane lipoprotein